MPTRYQQLRQAIANLAAPATEQRSHLESIFPNYGSPLPHGFNADELGLEFEIYLATGDMLECGEISQKEIDTARPLDELLDKLSGKQNGAFWTVGALFDDARWDEVRRLASEALSCYPRRGPCKRVHKAGLIVRFPPKPAARKKTAVLQPPAHAMPASAISHRTT